MNLWHAFTDSDEFRWLVKSGPSRRFFHSRTFRNLNVARNHVLSSAAHRKDPARFADVRTFCFFVGHNKSGTSLVGGLLDAHPEVVLADEADALQYVEAGFKREQIFHVLLKGARTEARKSRVTARRLMPYSYSVPGQWQGVSRAPLVVGDSTSGSSTRRLGSNPDLLDRLPEVIPGVDIKLIQVIRNPFDPISAMMVRGGRSFENAIDHYFRACETLARIRKRVQPNSLLPVRYETFVADPEQGLAAVCRFLGVDADPEYLSACGAIIRRRPDRTRRMVDWNRTCIEDVERRTARVDFLRGYSYAN